ncbi:MAG: metallophosphoesterase family protein [Myxococcota bacterium]
MRILELKQKPIHRVRYTNAAKRGGVATGQLEVLRATVDTLPEGVRGLLATSDLQGVVAPWQLGGETVLLGEHLPEHFSELSSDGSFPNPATLGAILAGDLYSAPGGDVRGATGDVRSVWNAFAQHFSWVVGVAGNHDLFGSNRDAARFAAQPNVHLLDGEALLLGDARIGGIGYIIGDPAMVGRRDRDDYLAALSLVLEQRPEILILHNGPHGDWRQRGDVDIRDAILSAPPLLVICGHSHWDAPLHELENGTQILNVDARAVLLAT